MKALDRDGNPVNGARVLGVAMDDAKTSTTLGRMDDSASEAGMIPVGGTNKFELRRKPVATPP